MRREMGEKTEGENRRVFFIQTGLSFSNDVNNDGEDPRRRTSG
jgi:hypothetical protein